MFPICRIGKTYGDAPVALALCPATLPDLQNGKCQLRAGSRHGVAMGTALRPENGTTFALEAQTD
jgi:hypothetical protein